MATKKTNKATEPSTEDVEATTDPAPVIEGEHGPEVSLPAVDGRPACKASTLDPSVEDCELPEYEDGAGLCGGHWALRPDLRLEARHDV